MDVPSYCTARILVLACGNRLRGDDGFSPVVADRLRDMDLPEGTMVVDAGTAVGSILLDLMISDAVPDRIVLLDIGDFGGEVGDMMLLGPEDIPESEGMYLHTPPEGSMLREIAGRGVDVKILLVQAGSIPDEVTSEVSPELMRRLPEVLARVMELLKP